MSKIFNEDYKRLIDEIILLGDARLIHFISVNVEGPRERRFFMEGLIERIIKIGQIDKVVYDLLVHYFTDYALPTWNIDNLVSLIGYYSTIQHGTFFISKNEKIKFITDT